MGVTRDILRNAGLKATPARISIVEHLMNDHGPFSIEDLLGSLNYTCDQSTLYRNVTRLVSAKIIDVADLGDGVLRYEYNPPHGKHHHHHIVCEICRHTVKTDICVDPSWLKRVEQLGFKGAKHRLEFFGVCRLCL